MPESALSRVRALVFDLDDTLFDAREWQLAALQHAVSVRGLNPEAAQRAISDYQLRGNLDDPGLYNAMLLASSQSDSGVNIRALHDAVLSYQGDGQTWLPFPGAVEALLALGKLYRLVLLCDGRPESQRSRIEALRLEPLFERLVFSDSIDGPRSRRPDPRGLEECVRQLGLEPGQMLFIADDPLRDFVAARQIQMLSCRVFSGPHRHKHYPDRESRPEFEVTSAARIAELMAKGQQQMSARLRSSLPFLK
ncbi:HAD family hydrolase [bacterium]|nr:HAD family hydrolase [bacterium]